MKRVILAMTALLLLGICGVGALLAAGALANQQLQTPVFQAIADEDVDGFLALCDPSIQNEIDPPMLHTWMAAMNDALGQCQFESVGSFNINIEKQAGKTILKSEGGMRFEQGKASSDLTFVNGKIVSFQIDSDRLAKDWFNGPNETDFYRKRSEVVIRTLLDRRLEELKPMMHQALREAADDATLNNICDLGNAWAGDTTTINATGTKFERKEGKELIVSLLVTGDQGVVNATVKFTFDGLKGLLIGFNLEPIK